MVKSALYVFGLLAFVAIIAVGATSGLKVAVDKAVSVAGLHTAELWTRHLEQLAAGNMPAMESEPEAVSPDAGDHHAHEDDHGADLSVGQAIPSAGRGNHIQVEGFGSAGDVFHYHVVTATQHDDGHIATAGDPSDHSHDTIIETVRVEGVSQSQLHHGAPGLGLPDTYIEAFVPLHGADGTVTDVAQVMVDQTVIARLFHQSFSVLSLSVAAIFALVFSIAYIAFVIKTRQEARSRKQVDYLARYDQVTQLLNRAGFTSMLDQKLASGDVDLARTGMIFIDLDHFKSINDTFGHKGGDAFLRHVGEAISRNLADGDVAGRLGGDEFVILAQRGSVQEIETLVKKIQAAASVPVHRDGQTIRGHLSLGIHYAGDTPLSLEARMQKADIALYEAKMEGRNTYCIFTPDLEARQKRRQRIETAIRAGIDNDRFELHFQPLLHQGSKQCAGFEALLRLNDAEGIAIPPAEFIPIAEAMGVIGTIGSWVLEKAVTAAREWPEPLFVAVNLSARQFDDGSLVSIVKRALAKSGLDPKRLELEVTESLLMDNTEKVATQLDALRQLGVSIAMDDFGTGYSSLGYLWKFGFDKIKIDRSFIAGLADDKEKVREVLETIILLGHRLDMTVTAEGIETEEQAEVLSDLECDYFQGYLYAKAMPDTELAAFVLSNLGENDQQPAKAPGLIEVNG